MESIYRLTVALSGVGTAIFQPTHLVVVGLFIILVPVAAGLMVFLVCLVMGATKKKARKQAIRVISRMYALPRPRDSEPPDPQDNAA